MPQPQGPSPAGRLALAALALLGLALGVPASTARAEDAPPAPPVPGPEGGGDPGAGDDGGDEGVTKSLDERIGVAVDRGVKWLKSKQLADGSYGLIDSDHMYDPKADPNSAYKHPAGSTALALYALMKCGVPVDDPVVKKCFQFLRSKHKTPGSSYEISALILAVVATADPFKATKDSVAAGDRVKLSPEYRSWCQSLVDALLARRAKFKALGWRYNVGDPPTFGGNEDLSSTQLATLAFLAAERCGVKIDSKVWNEIITYTLRQQEKDGPEHPRAVWPRKPAAPKGAKEKERYAPPPGTELPKDRARGFAYMLSKDIHPDEGAPTGSMTACGICNLQMARYVLAVRQDKVYLARDLRGIQQSIYDGLAWLAKNFSSFNNPGKQSKNVYHVYYLYCCERAFDLLGNQRIGDHVWFPEMAESLLGNQGEDGSWNSKSTHRPEAVLDTCFALLFLRRATKGGIPHASLTDPGDAPPTDARGN
jgi:hypothetical protein